MALDDLQQQACAVLDGAAIWVGAVIGAVLEELVDEVAIRAMQLDAVETGSLGPLSRAAIVLDDAVDFRRLKRAVRVRASPSRRGSRSGASYPPNKQG